MIGVMYDGSRHLLQAEDVRGNAVFQVCSIFDSERGWQLLVESYQSLFQFKDHARAHIPRPRVIDGIVALVDDLY
jgi:hypothetical protein